MTDITNSNRENSIKYMDTLKRDLGGNDALSSSDKTKLETDLKELIEKFKSRNPAASKEVLPMDIELIGETSGETELSNTNVENLFLPAPLFDEPEYDFSHLATLPQVGPWIFPEVGKALGIDYDRLVEKL